MDPAGATGVAIHLAHDGGVSVTQCVRLYAFASKLAPDYLWRRKTTV